ncbi:RNA polymerase sigma factor [Alkaliphilus hydrothermalis]|uniref:RNA polymerase sigma factor (Sigma-70 family) n=1 Tax=Alkaliphilus hydrothermalis TaxID=1482730 RepID=A0ABS2NN24_9FIRM|nr:RNA polymerase sigma factor [Alkaliphilus hydrothermalis]MBM7614321.1 RNA polymerase sigma factor (sigma-70 family) [Alkaliphilus hydrothermalis]
MEQEALLIKRATRGDEAAFREIVDGYKKYVFAIILNITKNQQEAENIAQETFLKVYSSLQNYQGQGFKGWIGKIAVHKAIDWNRKRHREGEGLLVYMQNQESTSSLTEPSPEERILKEEEVKKLKMTLQQLPHKYGGVLEKYFLQSMSYKEIAELEGISVRTVESRLYRGKNLLREAWREEGYDATL